MTVKTNKNNRYLKRFGKNEYQKIKTIGELSDRRTPHPNPLPGVPGRGDKTLPWVNCVVFGSLGVLEFTRHEDRLPQI